MNTPIESKKQARELTTTSYGVLAVLALRDHSTYELTKQLRFSLHYIWPRAVGPRVEDPAFMLINQYPWSAPLEAVRLKKK